MCIERCKHGSGGGAGASSKEASRVYPTETALLAPWSRAAQPCGGIGQVPGSDHLHLFGSWPLSIARFLIAS